jgi:hypothetical protein
MYYNILRCGNYDAAVATRTNDTDYAAIYSRVVLGKQRALEHTTRNETTTTTTAAAETETYRTRFLSS